MSTPIVVIVGRPNVGKSTLFNALARRRISIIEPSSGVTRDRVSVLVSEPGRAGFELVDTGGMGGPREALRRSIEDQIQTAIRTADAVIFVVDGKDGLLPQDGEIASRLRKLGKPVFLVVNKMESRREGIAAAAEFYRLGFAEPLIVSALHRLNIGELRERLFELAEAAGPAPAPEEPVMKLAVVGRQNVGKSTFINALAHEERVIVSEIPGTTRDSIDVRFQLGDKVFIAIDTAGLRKRGHFESSIEFYSQVRAQESIRRADVVLLMFDPRETVGEVDKKLAETIVDQLKPCVIVVNKWDLARGTTTEAYAKYFSAELPGLAFAPMCFVSAKEQHRVTDAVRVALSLWEQAHIRVPTPEFNAVIEELKTIPQTGGTRTRKPKIYYGAQVGIAPPTIVLFVNSPAWFTVNYRRVIANFFRRRLPYHEIPIAVHYRKAAGGRRPRGAA